MACSADQIVASVTWLVSPTKLTMELAARALTARYPSRSLLNLGVREMAK